MLFICSAELSEREKLTPLDDPVDDEEREYRQIYSLKDCLKYNRRCQLFQFHCTGGRQHYKCLKWQNRCSRYTSFCVIAPQVPQVPLVPQVPQVTQVPLVPQVPQVTQVPQIPLGPQNPILSTLEPEKCFKYNERCRRFQLHCTGVPQPYKCLKWQVRCNLYKTYCAPQTPQVPVSPTQPIFGK